jgi:hypothetical protein
MNEDHSPGWNPADTGDGFQGRLTIFVPTYDKQQLPSE